MEAVDILILDEGENTLNDLKRLLESEGCRISAAADPAKACESLRSFPAGVIIAGPGLSPAAGLPFLREARALCPHSTAILLTDQTTPETRAAIAGGGISVLLKTPYDDDELLSVVLQAMQLFRVRRELIISRGTKRKKKILVVDDDKKITDLIKISLARQGYEAASACDGAEGLERLKEENPDLIILDVNMPRMNGIDFFRNILDGNGKPMYPVLVLTSRDKLEEIFREAEAAGFLPKPFELDDLSSEINRILQKGDSALF